MNQHTKVAEHVAGAIDLVLDTHYPFAEPPTLALDTLGFPSPRQRARDDLITEVLTRLDDFEHGNDGTVEMLARMCMDMIWLFHRRVCARQTHSRPCQADAKAVDALIQALAVSTLAQEIRSPFADTLLSIINAQDLDPEEQFKAITAHLGERLHPRDSRRDVIRFHPGTPVIQFNSPYQAVDDETYAMNRKLMLRLASVAEQRGYMTEVTSDYAFPHQEKSSDEHLVRSGILRSAGSVVLTTGGRTGTGRTLEAASIFMIPCLVLRSAAEEDPLNPDRYSGPIFDQRARRFSDGEEAVGLFNEFLDSCGDQIAARHEKLMLWDDEPLGREGDLVLAADQSLFERSGLSYEQAIFWIDPVNWAQAPSSVRSEIRAVLNIDDEDRGLGGARQEAMSLGPYPSITRFLGTHERPANGLRPPRA